MDGFIDFPAFLEVWSPHFLLCISLLPRPLFAPLLPHLPSFTFSLSPPPLSPPSSRNLNYRTTLTNPLSNQFPSITNLLSSRPSPLFLCFSLLPSYSFLFLPALPLPLPPTPQFPILLLPYHSAPSHMLFPLPQRLLLLLRLSPSIPFDTALLLTFDNHFPPPFTYHSPRTPPLSPFHIPLPSCPSPSPSPSTAAPLLPPPLPRTHELPHPRE